MADNSAKLKAEIAFLTKLIRSHKQAAHPSAGSKRQASAMQYSKGYNKRSFSWQRSEQSAREKQQEAGQSLNYVQNQASVAKSSFSLDRRKKAVSSSATMAASMNASPIPGSSGLQPFLATKDTNSSVLNSKGARQHKMPLEATPKHLVPTRTSSLVSDALSPAKSNEKLPPSSPELHVISSSLAKNPYILNKKDTSSFSSVKPVAQKSKLKWLKPSTSISSQPTDDSKSNSDSELYTKKSSFLSDTQPSSSIITGGKSRALTLCKATSTVNIHRPFKWSKTSLRVTDNSGKKKSVKKSKLSRSKLKWIKPGIRYQAGLKTQVNPYVLRKGNCSTGNKNRKQGSAASTAVTSQRRAKKAVYSKSNQGSVVWRAPGSLKLDRRKAQSSSKLLSGRPSSGFIERRQKAVLTDNVVVSRYSVVRSKRKQTPIKAQKLNKVVVIGGVSYKMSSNKLTKAKVFSTAEKHGARETNSSESQKMGKMVKTVTIQGEKFIVDSKGKTLRRIDKVPRRATIGRLNISRQNKFARRSSNGQKIIVHTPTTLIRSKASTSQNQAFASRVLRRSITNARLSNKNKTKPASEQYCMFYNRFGKCNKQAACPYIHDPSKVAVCTKFLLGRCKNLDGSCPFSHKIDRDKMPVCQFFLRGTCSNDNCPYSHVNVSKKAEVCEDFLKGFCSRGQQCKKKHILECEEFARTGKCPKGSKCKLMHRTRKSALRKRKSSTKEEDTSKRSKRDFNNDDGFLPLTACASDSEQSSAQEPLDNTTTDETKQMTVEPLVIRPRFLKSKEAEK